MGPPNKAAARIGGWNHRHRITNNTLDTPGFIGGDMGYPDELITRIIHFFHPGFEYDIKYY